MNYEDQASFPMERVIELFGITQLKIIKGGSVNDYVCAHLKSTGEDHTAADAFRWLQNMMKHRAVPLSDTAHSQQNDRYRLLNTEPIEDLALIRYLERIHIPISLAYQLLEELHIKALETGRRFYAVGFKNDDGGYCFYNPMVKGAVGVQTVSFVRNKAAKKSDTINLFSNFMDMLSAFTRFPESYREQDSICVNAPVHLQQCFGYITGFGYQNVCTWMENTEQGRNTDATIGSYVSTQSYLVHKRMNSCYLPYHSVSQWHVATKS